LSAASVADPDPVGPSIILADPGPYPYTFQPNGKLNFVNYTIFPENSIVYPSKILKIYDTYILYMTLTKKIKQNKLALL
jgi:hypothetical protein